ncbi:hypothetical protein CYMTET_28915 [Cymbomonas tetramitiformis]|uniref:Trichohyalin-plectin-homology domain-containing protein n=1 Tax=Cymbomonas tetramitiformis TaxID=36881 RepID=A0AAE0FMJ6_9CHLO|nr:hypothetical protein CYMTET_28915 [Cymbomonas tetramitiformis]
MSRPATGIGKMSISGTAPPTALKTGRATSSRRGTGCSTAELKDALTATLVQKMRERFNDVAMDVKTQDIIGTEVVNFMAGGGSVKAEDIGALEERIRSKLSGGTAKTLKSIVKMKEGDEWAMLARFESDQNVVEELRRREAEQQNKKRVKAGLDMQMEEMHAKEQAEKNREAAYAAEERNALDNWQKEEHTKLLRKQDEMKKLKCERDAQLQDQASRRTREANRLKGEEDEAREMLRLEHRRKMEEDDMTKQRNKEAMDTLKMENAANLALLDKAKQKEMEEDLMYQKLMAKMLDKQEMERKEKMSKIKSKQDKLLAVANSAPRPIKKWMDEDVIDRNFKEREAVLDAEEDARMERVQESNLEMRRVLAAQLREKESRKKNLNAAEAQRVAQFNVSLKESESREAQYKAHLQDKRLQNKADLEAQMREKAMSLDQAMNAVERTLNSKLLDKVRSAS